MSSVGESRLNHARREHGCFAPSFMDGLRQSVGEAWSGLWLELTFTSLNASLRVTSTQLQPMHPIMSGRRVKMCRTALKGLHHVLRIRITQITTAMTARMAWLPCGCNVMLMWCFLPLTRVLGTRHTLCRRTEKWELQYFTFACFLFFFFLKEVPSR